MFRIIKFTSLLVLLSQLVIFSLPLQAGEVEIIKVDLRSNNSAKSWTFHVTLKHNDTGWNHYADAWQVVDSDGKVLGKRILHHPHEHEQPFTRSLSGVTLPENAIIYVQAHDKVHGWSKDRVKIDFDFPAGDRYTIGEYTTRY